FLDNGDFAEYALSDKSIDLWTELLPSFLDTIDTNDATSSTTVAAPPVFSEQAAAIASFETAWNHGNEEALRALFTPDASVDQEGFSPGHTDVNQIVAWALARNAMEVVASIDECAPAGETVRCNAEFDGPVFIALNLVPLRDTYTFTFEDGLIARISFVCQICENRDLEFKMGQWVRVQAPGATPSLIPSHTWVKTPEHAAFFLEWAVRWQEAGRP
ncbi:MAG: nuclear transport factor 2 family protein, partial [Acidimicrobiia bacterium]